MSLDALFAPRAVAVLGVSRNPAKLGHRLLQNVVEGGFTGTVLPVNPSGEPVLGLPTVPTVDGLPEGLDLALVSLPASAVPGAIEALAARRVRAAVVLSSGFGEVDDAGRGTQARLLAAARDAGLRLVGPNCMGVYSAPARLNGTYFWDLPAAPEDAPALAVVSQSGAYGGLIFRHLGGRGFRIARFLSIGNQADVDIAEVIEYLADDASTALIACFVEALRDGERFVRAAARATVRKPVVVLKGGRSDAGRRAAGSHTGSLAGSYETYRAAFRRAGVVTADETEEFFDAVEALLVARVRPAAPRIAIVTVSGGPSVVAADCAERSGLAVPALDDAARSRLRELLPSFAAVGNPVDLTPQVEPSRIAEAVGVVLREPSVSGVVAVNVGLDIPEFAHALVSGIEGTGKPVVAFAADAPRVADVFRRGGVPVLPSPERAVRAMRALWHAARASAGAAPLRGGAMTGEAPSTASARSVAPPSGPGAASGAGPSAASAPSVTPPSHSGAVTVMPPSGPSARRHARSPGADAVTEEATASSRGAKDASSSRTAVTAGSGPEIPAAAREVAHALEAHAGPIPYALARRLLEAHGVRFCRERHVSTVDEAVVAAGELGYPVVLKADALGLAHKTEAGAVRLDVASADAVRAACEDFVARLGAGQFIVQERAGPGVELLVGARRDPVFGPLVALGAGGVLTEVVADVSLRLVPLTEDEAREMLEEGLRPRLLAGPRGLVPVAADALLEVLHAVSSLMAAEPRILEIDLNPVIAAGRDAVAVDALVIVGDRDASEGQP